MEKLKQKEIKQAALDFLKKNAEFEDNYLKIAFYAKERGTYSGVSSIHDFSKNAEQVYGFIIDFPNSYFSIEGISGKKLKNNAANLNKVFGDDTLIEYNGSIDTLAKFSKMATVLGSLSASSVYGGGREKDNFGRGLLRAIKQFPVAEQLVGAKWFHKDPYYSDSLRSMISSLQFKLKYTKSSSLKKALGYSNKRYNDFMSQNNAGLAYTYYKLSDENYKYIEQTLKVAKQVDLERGYHDAEKWHKWFKEGIMRGYYSYSNNLENCLDFINPRDKTSALNHLVKYLYGSCYHQQALKPDSALRTLSDYYRLVKMDKHPVKYPRYLMTIHDVASANYEAVSDSLNARGVLENYVNNYNLEGQTKDYTFIVAATPEEIANEANQQSNCVAGYIDSVAAGDTLIMFMRQTRDIHSSWVTFEVNVGSSRIVQAYATFNNSLNGEQAGALYGFARAHGLDMSLGSVPKAEPKRLVLKPLIGFHSINEQEVNKEVMGNNAEFGRKVVSA